MSVRDRARRRKGLSLPISPKLLGGFERAPADLKTKRQKAQMGWTTVLRKVRVRLVSRQEK
jgi:hypothetical protein